MLHLVGSSILLYLIDDARSNKNQVYMCWLSTGTKSLQLLIQMVIVVVGFVVFSLLLQFHLMYRIINTRNSGLFSLLNEWSVGGFFFVVLRPNAGHGLLVHEVSISRTTTHNSRQDSSERVISSSHTPVLRQHTTLTTGRHPCPRRDSNPHSQLSSGCWPTPQTARLLGPALH